MRMIFFEGTEDEIAEDIVAEARLLCKKYCSAVNCDDGCKDTWPGCGGQLRSLFGKAAEIVKLRSVNERMG
jgi:hypothetical protein